MLLIAGLGTPSQAVVSAPIRKHPLPPSLFTYFLCINAHAILLGSPLDTSQITEIKEAVELPLTHPELYEDIGIKPPKVGRLHLSCLLRAWSGTWGSGINPASRAVSGLPKVTQIMARHWRGPAPGAGSNMVLCQRQGDVYKPTGNKGNTQDGNIRGAGVIVSMDVPMDVTMDVAMACTHPVQVYTCWSAAVCVCQPRFDYGSGASRGEIKSTPFAPLLESML